MKTFYNAVEVIVDDSIISTSAYQNYVGHVRRNPICKSGYLSISRSYLPDKYIVIKREEQTRIISLTYLFVEIFALLIF